MGYTKLFYEIILSTVWREKDTTRLVWITMLALRNKHHVVEASVPGLADAARVSLEDCQKALEILSSPDKWSRTQDEEGRRIKTVDGGWFIINGEKFRRKMSEEERREKNAIYQKNFRERKKSVRVDLINKGSKHSKSTEKEKEKEKVQKPSVSFMQQLKADPLNIGIDIDRELERAKRWCRDKNRRCTERFFKGWVERADRVIKEEPTVINGKLPPMTPEQKAMDEAWRKRWNEAHGLKKD